MRLTLSATQRFSLGLLLGACLLWSCQAGTLYDPGEDVSDAICGDGAVDELEACDDGNATSGDGCSEDCQLEAGFDCVVPGESCTPQDSSECGNGTLEGSEQCDDGDTDGGDGCNALCVIEDGFECHEAGESCRPIEVCGDGRLGPHEACDDGNATPDDGCNETCTEVEEGSACPVVGSACVPLGICGNGLIDTDEACDDLNNTGGDGCSADCSTIENDFACPDVGAACVPLNVCGNGLAEIGEACDDGNNVDDDGCAGDCTAVEAGFVCPDEGESCVVENICGNGISDDDEACDDGNVESGDGCSADCSSVEGGFVCVEAGEACVEENVCGNGLLDSGEACDDGNDLGADGCSADCSTVETGFVCVDLGQACVVADVCGNGVVEGDEACDDGNTWASDGCVADCSEIETGYSCDDPGELCVEDDACGNGQLEAPEICDDGNQGGGDGCSADCTAVEAGYSCPDAGEDCEINCGNGTVETDDGEVCDDSNRQSGDGCNATCSAVEAGFYCATPGEACEFQCGNNIVDVETSEACDDGNTEDETDCPYGQATCSGCDATCENILSLSGRHCGDGTVDTDEGEICDDGNNFTETACPFGVDTCTRCDATCENELSLVGGRCGDGVVDDDDGEVCDDGNTVSETECAYGVLTCTTCNEVCSGELNLTGPHCGDGIAQTADGETCDDGNNLTEANCPYGTPTCELCDATCEAVLTLTGDFCGDGNTDGADGEACDDGNAVTEANCAYGEANCTQCDATCENTLSLVGPYCGDTNVDGDEGEVCDDGTNNGAYNGCNSDCQSRPAFCGDGSTDAPIEFCDDGLNNDGSYGGCRADCLPAASCGDGHVGRCAGSGAGCTDNGDCAASDTCGATAETCDDGRLDGSYGGCTDTCERAAYCGDGTTDLPFEVCDDGAGNTGTYGGCTPTCRLAAFCGDGRITDGEECDDGRHCSLTTSTTCTADSDCPGGETCGPVSGDGCDGSCDLEAGWSCPVQGASCVEDCGNGRFDAGEVCDDGNQFDGDGCRSDCALIEAGYTCGAAGNLCTENCGNRQVDLGVCDVARTACNVDGDCPGGETCLAAEVCDDGRHCSVTTATACTSDAQCPGGESCGPVSGDGCDDTCASIENGYECTPGSPCNLICGNGLINPGEQCDFGTALNDGSYGGCTAACQRAAYCGDSNNDPQEDCDDGTVLNDGSYGGCQSTCTFAPYCSDGVVTTPEEECDDGGLADGDGCDSGCNQTAGWVCPTPGEACNNACGNNNLDGSEACDDGNLADGDGCNGLCTLVEAGWDCPVVGEACVAAACGDGLVVGDEVCDDGNALSGDGCSDRCELEEGFHCPDAGSACEVAVCGNSVLEGLEECDDGGSAQPGCDDSCKVEIGYQCPTPGSDCTATTCGDSLIEGAEQCDDGGSAQPGCDANCQLEPGYACPTPGADCHATTCGDNVVEGLEECDDGGLCTGTVAACAIDAHCGAGETCFLNECRGPCTADADCGGGETCEPRAGDGCDPTCVEESIFSCDSTGNCEPECGDGITLAAAGEECDDGNRTSGDGCSAVCTVESGYTCTDFTLATPASIQVPITYRDFSEGHVDMQRGCGGGCGAKCGMVETTLDSEGKPVYIGPDAYDRDGSDASGRTCTGAQDVNDVVDSQASFAQWYRDVSGTNIRIDSSLTLDELPGGTCAGADASSCNTETDRNGCETNGDGCVWAPDEYQFSSTSFFPIDGLGFGNESNSQNYHFTSEVTAYFRYQGGESLDFFGDDDVWFYVNGVLAVDIGGVHPQRSGSIVLDNDGYDEEFDLWPNGIYQIKIFQAERQTTGSNYRLTIGGFVNTGTASCAATCGDGLIRGAEACDNGGLCTGDNLTACFDDSDCSGVGGTCTPRDGDGCDDTCGVEPGYNCTGEPSTCVEPVCGDDVVETPEECDDGNLVNLDGCSDTCTLELCGDGPPPDAGTCSINVATACNHDTDCPGGERCVSGEECDDGNTADFDACTNACNDAVCGDGIVRTEGTCSVTVATVCSADGDCPGGETCNFVEACDDGNAVDGDLCTNACTAARCGDGVVSLSLGEVCDDGQNNGGYGSCLFDCSAAAPSCGDGTIDPSYETCDDGPDNDGRAGGCRPDCTLSPLCGDATVGGECSVTSVMACNVDGDCPGGESCLITEECDDGVNDGAPGTCDSDCTLPAFCGDSVVAVSKGETCDNGVNDGSWAQNQGDSCTGACQDAPYCGDGLQNLPFEGCDLGTASNVGGYEGCNPDCSPAAYCGDGFLGICSASGNGCNDVDDCPPAESCDGTIETCDDGVLDNSYGGCTVTCGFAAYCGDGFRDFGEECDLGTANNVGGYDGCNADCTQPASCGDAKTGMCSGDESPCDVDGECLGAETCVQAGGVETCDDGLNDDSYGGCTATCGDAPSCGDAALSGVCSVSTNLGCNLDGDCPGGEGCRRGLCSDTTSQTCDLDADCPGGESCNQFETCDNGTNDGSWGANQGDSCTPSCGFAPYCGDGIISTVLGGETCDGNLFGGRTCSDLDGDGVKEPGDFDGGTLQCDDCGLNTDNCFVCGDGTRNGFEDCDGSGLCSEGADCALDTCEQLGFPTADGGGLACNFDCSYDTSGCETTTCDGGGIDGAEPCDGADLGNRDCNDLDGDDVTGEPGDFDGGTLSCTDSCTLDTSECTFCGDGTADPNELCDGVDTKGVTCSDVDGSYVGGDLTCNSTCDGYDESACTSCGNCSDCGGQACIDGQCGSCQTTADCCAPLECVGGTCILDLEN